ncbi:MAG: amidophosphoribosyltransferase [Pseudanabaenaceae cyanobacterium bins.68]|nr:amidophosphoribosyltransferase [Pseudanabaenaceae cyanobacterium bins.68]
MMDVVPVPEREDWSEEGDLSIVKSPWDSPREACGVYGIFSLPAEDVAKNTYFGLYALQHRGQEAAGIATFAKDHQGQPLLYLHKSMGLVSQVFNEQILAGLPGYLGVGHNRYSTTGSNRVENAQPIVVDTRLGKLALAHNGNLVNTWELRAELTLAGYQLESTSDSEAIAWAIALEVDQGKDWLEAIAAGMRHCQGAFSLVIGTAEGLAGARDPHGVRPLVIGQLNDGSYILASETCALDIVNAKLVRSVEPGELVWIDSEGIKSYFWQEVAIAPKLCVFEMIYFARPDSVMHHSSLHGYRQSLGKALAQESPVDADLVIGVPDSGIPAAIGYSAATGIPYGEGLIKNRYVGRTFIEPTQAMREAGIKMKLNPLRDELEGKRVIVIDDSIVRGTTSRKIVQALRDAGCTEVHMRISSPPVTHPCFYGIDTDSQDQLIASTKSVAEIGKLIGVDSLAFLSREGMLSTTAIDPNHFCTACFTGDYPIPVPDKIKQTKIVLESNP